MSALTPAARTPETPEVRTVLAVEGMTCSGCARNVGEALRSVPGVGSADVRLEEGRAVVEWAPGAPSSADAAVAAVKKAGYSAAPVTEAETAKPSKWSPFTGWTFNVVVGTILTIPLLVAEWGFGVGEQRWYHWAAFFMVLPIQTLCGARFYRGAWTQLKAGRANMDMLVALGSTTSFAYSTWGLFSHWHGHLFFMESASIITLISVGHWVEGKVSERAAGSLKALLHLAPPTARLIGENEGEVIVPVSQLRPGDRIIVKPGDRVPADAEVMEGASSVDESMLTGESLPVEKGRGAKVFAGAQNLHGWLLGKVEGTGESTVLAQIIAVVRRAQSSRANIQRLGDQVSSVFVPIVVLIALGAGLWWGLAGESALAVSQFLEGFLWKAHHPAGPWASAIYHAAAVLIIACPCAMGLATPIAIMAGTNAAAERGILIRDGIALEKSGSITAILFDKTGTLTHGKISVAEMEDYLQPQEQALGFHKIAASLAKPSSHPLSQAVGRSSSVVFPAEDWEEHRGLGVEGGLLIEGSPLSGKRLRLGSLAWLNEGGIDLARAAGFIELWQGRGSTVIGLASETQLLGVIALRDAIKPQARAVVEHLEKQGKKIFLVTGDNTRTARALGAQAGIPEANIFAETRPEAKARIVSELQGRGERVAFVGDGINDAPALEQADLGIAVSKASDIAREAADMILLKSDIQAVPEALALAQMTLRVIKQNLFWAFFYNAAGVPLAMFGFLSPMLSALAMGFSDLIVIGNALRLRRSKRWKAAAN